MRHPTIVRTILCCTALVVLFGAAADKSPSPTQFFVSTEGNDTWSGKMSKPNAAKTDGPFATLEQARDEIRAVKKSDLLPDGGISVVVAGGTYSLDKPFQLTEEDSGTSSAPITYLALQGEEVRLIGGKVVSGFHRVEDPTVLKRLDEAARGNVLQADLKSLGIEDHGSPEGGGMELFFQDQPMTVSRWPNEGFVRIVDTVVEDGHKIHGQPGSKVGKFVYEGNRPKRWIGESEPWLHGYWFWDWSEQRHRIESIDTEKSILSVEPPYHSYGYRKGQWYYAYNLLSELDTPGEWYVDRENGILYFWPPKPVGEGDVVVSRLPGLMRLENVSHVTLRGFILEGSRGTAVTVSGGTRNEVVGCTIRNVGGSAVAVSDGTAHAVIGCDIYRTGCGGIALSGGDRTTLTPAGHYAENNHIHHYSRVNRVYQPGISLQGVGNRASHNLIHNAPHMGMGFGGNDHVIEFNEIHSVCYESNDAGAIYTGRNWTMRGHEIRNNYLHHISGFENRGCVGIYLDDMFSSAAMRGNVFYKVTRAAFIGGGRDCVVENNVFVDCQPALHVDARALGWAYEHADMWIEEEQEKGTISGIEYNKPPYSDRYPQLIGIIADEPKAPKGNVISRNLCFGGKWDGVEDKARPYLTLKDNFVDEETSIEDFEAFYRQLEKGTLLSEHGLDRIPVEKIGLYEDARRASWPVQHSVREVRP